MKSALLILLLTWCGVCIDGRIQYSCHFGKLTVVNVEGRTMSFCKTPLADPKFVRFNDIVYSRPNSPCYECMCDSNGLACCQCRSPPLRERLGKRQRK